MPHRSSAALALVAALWLLPAPFAAAEADGPDFLRASGLEGGASLPLHAGPGTAYPALGALPGDSDGLANFGCRGGLDFAAWSAASEAQRAEAAARRWCLVGHGEAFGWAPGPHLAEGSDTGAFRGGDRLGALAGSEWTLAEPDGGATGAEAWIGFAGEGRMAGHGGCNRLAGSYEAGPGTLRIGPLAMTRMACPEPMGTQDERTVRVLEETRAWAGGSLRLVLMDDEGRILARLIRRDAD